MHRIERSLVQKFKGKPFAVLGVKVDGDLEALRSSEKLHNISWRSVLDEKHANLRTYGVSGTPTLFLIDHRGRKASKRLEGLQDERQLERAIRQLLDEAEQDAAQVAAE
jgi:predicted DsbA family dithiol-disulfide isomerase